MCIRDSYNGGPAVSAQETNCVCRVEGREYAWLCENVPETSKPERQEPYRHNGAEQPANRTTAVTLHSEERDEDDEGDRNNVGLEERCRKRKPLYSREHGDRWRDHAISIKESGASDTHDKKKLARPFLAHFGQGERQKRHDAALALIIRTHNEKHIFQRDNDNQRPDDQ